MTISSPFAEQGNRVLIAVATCIRPGAISYLYPTLQSLVWDGAMHDYIFEHKLGPKDPRVVGWFAMHDGPLPEDYSSFKPAAIRLEDPEKRRGDIFFPVDTWQNEPNMGARENLWRIFKRATMFMGWDRLLFFEDDIKFLGKNSLLRMLTCPFLPNEGLITFHDIKELLVDSPYGLYHQKVAGRENRGLWGLQAAAFPRRVVEHLAGQAYRAPWPHESRSASDRVVEYFLERSPWSYQSVHCPSLVRHIGEVSAACIGEPLWTRQSKREAAEDFDAGLLVGKPETRF